MTTEEAIKHFNNAATLARALGISKSAVSQWGLFPPRAQQLEIQELTGGLLRAEAKPKRAA
jgi:DNA-binding transcriptional regulator YdaS (Cro superfamily)